MKFKVKLLKAEAKGKNKKENRVMGESVLEKIRQMKERQAARSGGNFSSYKGVFHKWKDGANIVRLVHDFVEVRTHYIAPNVNRGEKGLCQAKAFQKGQNQIPQTINCLDWDIEKGEAKPIKTCPFCALEALARMALKEGPSVEEKKFYEALKAAAYARMGLKWHVIDREDPYVFKVENNQEVKVKGYKIATVGKEAWKDIEGIFSQCGFDISDPKEGVDLEITKTSGNKTEYSAKVVLTGKPPSVRLTPLTEEEASWQKYDLKALCGKMVDRDLLVDAMHEELRELLELNVTEPVAPTPPAPKKASAPASSSAPARRPVVATPSVAEEEEEGGDPLEETETLKKK